MKRFKLAEKDLNCASVNNANGKCGGCGIILKKEPVVKKHLGFDWCEFCFDRRMNNIPMRVADITNLKGLGRNKKIKVDKPLQTIVK